MTDDEIWAELADIRWDAENGNTDDVVWWQRMGDLEYGVESRRRELVELLRSTPEVGNRASILEKLTEYRRLGDELRASMQWRARRTEQKRERDAQRRYSDATLALTAAGNDLAAGTHAQAKALTFWTRWLAVATVVLALATLVLVIATVWE